MDGFVIGDVGRETGRPPQGRKNQTGCVQYDRGIHMGLDKSTRLPHWLLQATTPAASGYYTGHTTTMPGRASIQSRTLANVRLQLRTGKTRGSNPRPLSLEEVRALEARRDQLQTEMANRQRQRIVSRVNAH